ncbi:putative costunolide synthase [Rosa chinensis]|uniref:Putative costunolide synthase n=1 Tax=Rosa chinensis TaxID=74649 RepID=A0A2P6P3L9_ROSCH|nr:putative costunolide synthase [Rosa chinensis]
MSIRLGNVPTIIVSSPKAAEQFLKAHDTNFASRPKIQASEYIPYDTKSMAAFSEYGPYWSHVRKLCMQQHFCPATMEGFTPLRKEELERCENIRVMKEDITYKMVLGCKRDDRFDLKAVIEETFYLAGAFNISDFVPSLSALDIYSARDYTQFVALFLIPRESIEDITMDGYGIPKKSRIIVNYWSIGRDPNGWSENVEEFYPERFMNSNINLWGHDFQLIPFGYGRRGCPGLQLGLTTIQLVVAQPVPYFNWELPTGMLPQDLDMSENLAYQCQKPRPAQRAAT